VVAAEGYVMKESAMKRFLMVIIVCASFLFGVTDQLSAWNTAFYLPGIVVSTTAPDQIVIGTRTYTIAPGAEIVQRLKKGPSIYEKRATFSDIHPGDPVSVKVEASSVKHVIIERWRQ